MEVILYNKIHWMDRLETDDPSEFAERMQDPQFVNQYESRFEIGDVVEAREDGFFTGVNARGYNKNEMTLVIVPGFPLPGNLKEPLEDNDGKIKKVRKWVSELNIDGIDYMEVQSIGQLELKQKKDNK